MIKPPLGEPSNKFELSKLRPKVFFSNYTTLLKSSKFIRLFLNITNIPWLNSIKIFESKYAPTTIMIKPQNSFKLILNIIKFPHLQQNVMFSHNEPQFETHMGGKLCDFIHDNV
jgi:hypothetical protein